MKDFAIKKLYYSISEVSKMTSIKPYVLRYWETEFRELKPSKNRAGKRIYRRSDIELIVKIKKLLYQDKFTIEGARKKLRESTKTQNEEQDHQTKHELKAELLSEIRKGLNEIIELLNGK